MRSTYVLVAFLAVASLLSAQGGSLTTTFADNNGAAGNMFDVDASVPLSIVSFDIHYNSTTPATVEIYTIVGGGSYVGNETNPAAWTLVASIPNVVGAGTGVPTVLPPLPAVGALPIPVVPGTTQGIYITLTSGSLRYTNGTTLGAVYAQNADLTFYEGVGKGYPFGSTFSPRIWNGNINYTYGATPPTPEYQPNSDLLSLTVDGLSGNEFFPFVVSKDIYPACGAVTPPTVTVGLSSNASGTLYDLAVSSAPTVPLSAGAVNLPGLRFNIDISQPYSFVTGGLLPTFQPMPGTGLPGASGSAWNSVVSFPSAGTLSLQGVCIDAAAPAGLNGTSPAQIDIVAQPIQTSVAGPVSSTTNVTVDVVNAPTCWTTVGGIPFYGTTQSEMFVSPNGVVCFGGGGDTDTSPSIFDALNDDGRVGFWTSFDTTEGGTIDVTQLATDLIRVNYTGVVYDGTGTLTPLPNATFSIEFDCTSGGITIDGLQSIAVAPNPGTTSTTDDQWLGISPGLLGPATDPGAQSFSAGGGGGAANPTDMLYEFNDVSVSTSTVPASVTAGLNTLIFTPDGSGNYTWLGF